MSTMAKAFNIIFSFLVSLMLVAVYTSACSSSVLSPVPQNQSTTRRPNDGGLISRISAEHRKRKKYYVSLKKACDYGDGWIRKSLKKPNNGTIMLNVVIIPLLTGIVREKKPTFLVAFEYFSLFKGLWYYRFLKVYSYTYFIPVWRKSEFPCNHSPTFIHLHGVSVRLSVWPRHTSLYKQDYGSIGLPFLPHLALYAYLCMPQQKYINWRHGRE